MKITGFRIFLVLVLASFSFVPAQAQDFNWWNLSWNFRQCVEINSTEYSRLDWPIEYQINFTEIIWAAGDSADFDDDSIRVIEQNTSSGIVLYEISSQLDKLDIYDMSNNAIGTLVFLMNGTTAANDVRSFCTYFDTADNPKTAPSYLSNLTYSWSGEELNVNNTINATKGLRWFIDTDRGELTSGIYKVEDTSDNNFWAVPGANDPTIEYIQYSNASTNFSFDFRNNLTIKYA
ncbi:MAG: hypothetical protein GOU99_01935, partial [Candidatus Altiarchaeota archaeon]|nr:hypothetical protein [Candidatus Altiarchaeota archaeon]